MYIYIYRKLRPRADTQHFKSVVVVNSKANINSLADLRGKRSCHGGYNSTHGWDIPIGLLLATLTMTPDCRGELRSVSKFFEQSCAPGKHTHTHNCSHTHGADLVICVFGSVISV